MKRSRFTEEQVSWILREQEARVATVEVCRHQGVGSATFYKWKARFGGMDMLEAGRLLVPTRLSTRLPLDFSVEGSPCGGHD